MLGEHPDDARPVELHSGRYGHYVKHGKVNATIPREIEPTEITLEQALPLLAARAAKTGAGKPARAKAAGAKPAAKASKAKAGSAETKTKPARAKAKVKAKKKAAAGKKKAAKSAAKPARKKSEPQADAA